MSDVLLKLDKPCLKGVANDEALKQELLSAQVPQSTVRTPGRERSFTLLAR